MTTEAYNGEKIDSTFQQVYRKTSSWISSALGIIALFIGAVAVFLISSLEGTKEIKASNTLSGQLMERWENEHSDDPMTYASSLQHKDKLYYFVGEYDEVGKLVTWYWAYDGGLEYVFNDYKFYILTAVASIVSIIVAGMNYTVTARSAMQTTEFKKSIEYYRKKKEKIEPYTQYIPDFCNDINTVTYLNAKKDIVEDAGITWDYYNSKEFEPTSLDKWQLKKLTKIKKIKIIRVKSQDLLQEKGSLSTKIRVLPMGIDEHKKRFLLTGGVQKVISMFLSGLTAAFGFVLQNWGLGILYASMVLLSFIGAIITANDYTLSTLKNRYIAKGDLLNEMYNIKEKYTEVKNGNETNSATVGGATKELVQPSVDRNTAPSSTASNTI